MDNSANTMVHRIVWASLVVSQCIYLLIPSPGLEVFQANLPVMAAALAGVALLQTIGLLAWFRVGGTQRIQNRRVDPSTLEGAAQLFQVLMICWVLVESIAIYGLVLRFMGATTQLWLPFAVAGFALMAWTHPFQKGLRPPSDSAARGKDATPIG